MCTVHALCVASNVDDVLCRNQIEQAEQNHIDLARAVSIPAAEEPPAFDAERRSEEPPAVEAERRSEEPAGFRHRIPGVRNIILKVSAV